MAVHKDTSLSIKRVIASVQRTNHLNDKEMYRNYRELYVLLYEETITQRKLDNLLSLRSRIAEIKGLACPLNPSQPNNY